MVAAPDAGGVCPHRGPDQRHLSLTRGLPYESDALLAQVKDDSSQLGGAISGLVGQVAGLVGGLGLPGGATSVEESVAVLKSRDFALRFMREHGVLPYLFPTLWDPLPASGSPSNAGRQHLGHAACSAAVRQRPINPRRVVPGPSPDDAVQRFDDMRVCQSTGAPTFVSLSVRGPSPQVAQAWAAAMIQELNELLRQRALEDSRRAVELLSKRSIPSRCRACAPSSRRCWSCSCGAR